MLIRALDPTADLVLITDFFSAVADYIYLERGEGPGPAVIHEFFTDAPPGCDPAASHRLGLWNAQDLVAIADMSHGYPSPDAAYIGLFLVHHATRGTGAGPILLRHLEALARNGNASALYLAVLDTNPRGRAFWQREGFAPTGTSGEITLGQKSQIAHRLSKKL